MNDYATSYEELMQWILPLCPVEIATAAKAELDAERRRYHFSDYLAERAAIRLMHVIAYLKQNG